MRPNAEDDTRSPWYEAFAPHLQPQSDSVPAAASDATGAQNAAALALVEPEDSTEALFDCYNG